MTHSLLEEVWPTPLRPLPATTIIEFKPTDSGETLYVGAGTHLKGQAAEEGYLFKTSRDVEVLPLAVIDRKMAHSSDGSKITLTMQWSGELTNDVWQLQPFTFFLSTDHAIAGLLSLWLSRYIKSITVRSANRSYFVGKHILETFTPELESLALPIDVKQFWRLQLLQEYFYTPHVNDFITVDLTQAMSELPLDEGGVFDVTFDFNRIFPFEYVISENSFKLHCVPAINQFEAMSNPVQFVSDSKVQQRYPLETTQKNHKLFQVKSVYSPTEAESNDRGDVEIYRPITRFIPTRFSKDLGHYYYKLDLENDLREQPKHAISFFDHAGKPVLNIEHRYFVCQLECVNDDSVMNLSVGDICIPTADVPTGVTFLNITPLTLQQAPVINSHRHWPLISHLSLSPVFLDNVEAIKQVLLDFDIHGTSNLPAYEKHKRYFAGIAKVSSIPVDRLIRGLPVRGLRMDVYLDPNAYPDVGEMYRFGSLLSQVFVFCITDSSYLLTRIFNTQTDECWTLPQIKGSREQI
nr:type VI secretion system baseplate subunit TssF [Budvicia aquatica]